MTSTVLRDDTESPTPPDDTSEPARRPAWLVAARRFAGSPWPPRLVALLAALPVIATLVEVSRAGRLQHLDYLYQITRITNRDGSIKPFDLQNYLSNEHILGLPSLFYWLNIQLFAGDNRTLGVFVVVVAALTVLVLGRALPTGLSPMTRAGLLAAGSALVFSLHGLWNFTRAMSGTAWLTANLLVVLSLLLAVRGRWWPAWSLALLGSFTYGTVFALWPVLALVAVLRREALWRRLLPLAVGGLIVGVWLTYRPSAPLAGEPTTDIGSLVYFFLAMVGKIWSSDSGALAVVAGAVLLALYAALACSPVARARRLWFWWALGLHGVLCAGMIALARVDYGGEIGMHTARYTSISVLVSLPALVLLAAVVHDRIRERAGEPERGRVDRQGYRIAAVALVVGLLGYALGAPGAVVERTANKIHHVEAVAVRGGFSDAYRVYPLASELAPRLRAMGHYPFTDDFTLGCGGPELGSRLDLAEMTPLLPARGNKRPPHAAGRVERLEPPDPAPFFDGKRVPIFHGWAADAKDPVRCVVVVDGSGTIVGGGVSGIVRPDVAHLYAGITPNAGFVVIGPVDTDSRIVVLHESGTTHWLPAEVTPGLDGDSAAGQGG
ncbi:hypothetical protein [Actinophytocola xanthii]|uniref:Glycosyltransferase RgtA/B/C/D-like domain-containing protein n=1 Tax=Actinophytocola xanthii TaxID=1912961 RepID=A0A1Q8CXB8_9PSEU|nr:hypothetical protein [Actinophytocola xanthii]OLF18999.1 hypothetical protein BU204_03865 [Actinophytocola xanthii]